MRNKDKYQLMSFYAKVIGVSFDGDKMHVQTSEGTWSTKTTNYDVRERAIEAIGEMKRVYVSRNRITGQMYYSSVQD